MSRVVLPLVLLLLCAPTVSARMWTDASGMYHQEADLVEFDGQTVVLKKAEGTLVVVPLEQLSQHDQEFLKSKQAKNEIAGAASKDQTWTLVDGKNFSGKLEKFGKKDLVISRKLGELYVNGKPFDGLPPMRQYIVPLIVGHEEGKTVKTAGQIADVIAARKGADLVYPVTGAVFEIESGETVAVPIWLLSDKDRKVIEPQWNAWLDADKDLKFRDRRQLEQSTLARAIFNEHQRDRLVDHHLQFLQSGTQWNAPKHEFQVSLTHPNNGTSYVTITATDQFAAQRIAQAQYPNDKIDWVRPQP